MEKLDPGAEPAMTFTLQQNWAAPGSTPGTNHKQARQKSGRMGQNLEKNEREKTSKLKNGGRGSSFEKKNATSTQSSDVRFEPGEIAVRKKKGGVKSSLYKKNLLGIKSRRRKAKTRNHGDLGIGSSRSGNELGLRERFQVRGERSEVAASGSGNGKSTGKGIDIIGPCRKFVGRRKRESGKEEGPMKVCVVA